MVYIAPAGHSLYLVKVFTGRGTDKKKKKTENETWSVLFLLTKFSIRWYCGKNIKEKFMVCLQSWIAFLFGCRAHFSGFMKALTCSFSSANISPTFYVN